MSENETKLEIVTVQICELCLDGKGGICNVPGCVLCRNTAPDLPIRDSVLPRRASPGLVEAVIAAMSTLSELANGPERRGEGYTSVGKQLLKTREYLREALEKEEP